MSTASSVAQFMAILSGGVNPAMLRGNTAINAPAVSSNGKTGQATVNFQALVGNNTNAQKSIMADGLNMAQMSQADLEKIKSLSDGEFSAAAVWQFIRQQASIDGENSIVLNLSEKGIPQDVIDELQQLFGTNDLITVLHDPKLNSQLDTALKKVETETIDTPKLAGVIHAILNQNKGNIDNTITFKVDEGAPAQSFLDDLIRDGYIENQMDTGVKILPVIDPNTKQPINLTFVQQQIAGNSQLPQQATPVGQSNNPFALQGQNPEGEMPTPLKDGGAMDRAIQALANNKGEAPQSIADRLANMVNAGGNNQNANTQSSGFTSAMLNANGDALVNTDGEYIMPFEAGFKTASQAANPLTTQQNAAQSHPTSQMVALSLTKMSGKAANGESSQTYRLKLDPPEMGRIDIEMDVIEKTGQLKAIITAERPEALAMLQRDMHVLLKSMQDAGFESMTQQDLSFSLSQNNDNMAGDSHKNRGDSFGAGNVRNGEDLAEADLLTVQGEMTMIVDPLTGQRHINMMV